MRHRWLTGIVLLIGAYGIVRFAVAPGRYDISHPDDLIAKFETTAFESEHGGHPGSVYRWEGPVRIYLDGPRAAMHSAYVTDVAVQLSRLSGREVTLVGMNSPSASANFLVMLDTADGLADRLERFPALRDAVAARNPNGYAIVGGDGHEISVVIATVRDDRPEQEVRATLLEEISQGFGLMNDSDIVHPSVWTNNGPNLEALPANDRIIIRALYDPAIGPGMFKDDAMAVVRRLIPQLVTEVERHGEEALYQSKPVLPRGSP